MYIAEFPVTAILLFLVLSFVIFMFGEGSATKKKILCTIFSEKLVFEKGRVATTPFTEPIQVLFRIAWVLQGTKNKKE
jgi:amino acid permease